MKLAQFPVQRTFDEIDFAARPSVNKPLALELIKGEYLDQRENILLTLTFTAGKMARFSWDGND